MALPFACSATASTIWSTPVMPVSNEVSSVPFAFKRAIMVACCRSGEEKIAADDYFAIRLQSDVSHKAARGPEDVCKAHIARAVAVKPRDGELSYPVSCF